MRKYSRLCRDIYTLRRVNIYFHQVEFLLYPIGVSIFFVSHLSTRAKRLIKNFSE